MEDRYVAGMVLSGVGDSLGYRNGTWEFNFVGKNIAKEVAELGGVANIKVTKKDWPVSDDTVLNLANAEVLVKRSSEPLDKDKLFTEIALNYKACCAKDMHGRAPGRTTVNSCSKLRPHRPGGWKIPFNETGGGCGASMRSMCIGLRYPNFSNTECLERLIEVSVESSRMTHHHPTGFLGGFASALFTSLAIMRVPAPKWGSILMSYIPKIKEHIKKEDHYTNVNLENFDYFVSKWDAYLNERGIKSGETLPVFPKEYGFEERDKFYKSLSKSGWGGASGHDSVIIAYDAFLAQGDSWDGLCNHGMFHGGDSDSTGVMAACWYGATHGFSGVPENNFAGLEYRERLTEAGKKLCKLALQDGYIKE